MWLGTTKVADDSFEHGFCLVFDPGDLRFMFAGRRCLYLTSPPQLLLADEAQQIQPLIGDSCNEKE